MKVAFFTLHWGYLRNFQFVLRRLAADGHEILLLTDVKDDTGSAPMIEDLCRGHPNVRTERVVRHRGGYYRQFVARLGHATNYLRFLQPMYAKRGMLRRSLEGRMPPFVRWLVGWAAGGSPRRLRLLQRTLRAMQSALPPDRALLQTIRDFAPDVAVFSPLLSIRDDQFDALGAAQRLGCRNLLCVGSWDHLSSKAYLRIVPDRILVWNRVQLDELERYHGVDSSRVVVTGAQAFDDWFDRQPVESSREFRSRVGLDPQRPYALYLCSCLFHMGPPEAPFVVRWIRWLREHPDQHLRELGVLIRPHPERRDEWSGIDLTALGNVVMWGETPVTTGAREEYLASMHHAAMAMGLNTTALIEAGILGRPVHTMLVPELADSQTATLHFHYLTGVAGGLLHVTDDWNEHGEQLLRSLARPADVADPRSMAFTRAFVRPHGLDRAAGPVFLEELAAYASGPRPDPVTPDAADLAVRYALLYPTLVAAFTWSTVAPLLVALRRRVRRLWRGFWRLLERVERLPLAVEKRLWPGIYVRIGAFGQRRGGFLERCGRLYTWARHDTPGREIAEEVLASGAGPLEPGSEAMFPRLPVRWALLWPLIACARLARAASAVRARVLKRGRKVVRLARHQAAKERPVQHGLKAMVAKLRTRGRRNRQ